MHHVAPPPRRWSVEYNLTEHCHLRCYNCDHAAPLMAPAFASLGTFVEDLRTLARVFHAEEIRLVGGEPLLHPELVDFLTAARRSGVADRVVVITNGALLHRMPLAFWEAIDDLRVSLYPGVERPLSTDACAVICADRGIRFEADAKQGMFQRTLVNQRINDPELVRAIFASCRMARDISCHTVHDGRFYRCSIAPFLPHRLLRLGMTLEGVDGVPLHNTPRLGEELEACLSGNEPLAACRYCLGTNAPWTPHRQMSDRDVAAWLAEDHEELIVAVRERLLGARR